jgi:transposase-like protein
MSQRKRYTAEEKVKVLRALQEEGKAISQVAEEYGIPPNNIFKWRKQHLEMGVQGFKTTRKDCTAYAELAIFRTS